MIDDIDARLAADAARNRAAAMADAEDMARQAIAAGIDGNAVLRSAYYRQAAPLYRAAGCPQVARLCVRWADRSIAESGRIPATPDVQVQ